MGEWNRDPTSIIHRSRFLCNESPLHSSLFIRNTEWCKNKISEYVYVDSDQLWTEKFTQYLNRKSVNVKFDYFVEREKSIRLHHEQVELQEILRRQLKYRLHGVKKIKYKKF
ncbi:unnamed protein product [Didymodactylos carnosus]|nr:unnamed protein product [Didymodactylos carnosus]CAF4353787.1 unnamed protein product [Didymodactylos carnosus]